MRISAVDIVQSVVDMLYRDLVLYVTVSVIKYGREISQR